MSGLDLLIFSGLVAMITAYFFLLFSAVFYLVCGAYKMAGIMFAASVLDGVCYVAIGAYAKGGE